MKIFVVSIRVTSIANTNWFAACIHNQKKKVKFQLEVNETKDKLLILPMEFRLRTLGLEVPPKHRQCFSEWWKYGWLKFFFFSVFFKFSTISKHHFCNFKRHHVLFIAW